MCLKWSFSLSWQSINDRLGTWEIYFEQYILSNKAQSPPRPPMVWVPPLFTYCRIYIYDHYSLYLLLSIDYNHILPIILPIIPKYQIWWCSRVGASLTRISPSTCPIHFCSFILVYCNHIISRKHDVCGICFGFFFYCNYVTFVYVLHPCPCLCPTSPPPPS